MSDGFMSWYRNEWGPRQASAMVADLERRGWSLTNPYLGVTRALVDGGEAILSKADAIKWLTLEDRNSAVLQWWVEGAVDVLYSVARTPNGVMHEFDLDGVGEYLERIVTDVAALVQEAIASTNGVIVDRYGGSQEVPWDAIVAGGDIPIDVMPDVLALPRDVDARHPEIASYEPNRTIGDLVVRDPGGTLSAPAD